MLPPEVVTEGVRVRLNPDQFFRVCEALGRVSVVGTGKKWVKVILTPKQHEKAKEVLKNGTK